MFDRDPADMAIMVNWRLQDHAPPLSRRGFIGRGGGDTWENIVAVTAVSWES
jgi:hypothetical protein